MEYSQPENTCQPKRGNLVDAWAQRLRQTLWPSTCVLCGMSGQIGLDLCLHCERELPQNGLACGICAQPLPAGRPAPSLCGACQRRPPAFQSGFIPFRYAYPLDHLIQGLKYRREVACGRVLGELLARRLLMQRRSLPEVIVPVPLGTARYRQRGYNQATQLALQLEERTGIAIQTNCVVRTRETHEQAALGRKERRRNVRHAFAVTGALRGSSVAILDDVVTTGSTVNELAKALRRAGARRIEVWAVARAGHLNTYSSAMPANTAMPK